MNPRAGLVHIDLDGTSPSLYHVQMAAALFEKANRNATRALNPLFALKCDKPVDLVVRSVTLFQ